MAKKKIPFEERYQVAYETNNGYIDYSTEDVTYDKACEIAKKELLDGRKIAYVVGVFAKFEPETTEIPVIETVYVE